MPYSWCRVMLRHSLYITHKPAKPNCLSFACFSFSVWVVDWDFCLKGLDACQVCKKTIQTSKYDMVVAPNLNHFPKADLAHLCYSAVWPCFIAGSAFLCYISVFTTMHLPSFMSCYFTFAYSKSHDTVYVIYSKSILLKTHLDLLRICCVLFWVFYAIAFQRYRISASALQSWLGFSVLIF